MADRSEHSIALCLCICLIRLQIGGLGHSVLSQLIVDVGLHCKEEMVLVGILVKLKQLASPICLAQKVLHFAVTVTIIIRLQRLSIIKPITHVLDKLAPEHQVPPALLLLRPQLGQSLLPLSAHDHARD